jgi:AmiR/NasT family two-component response regulator
VTQKRLDVRKLIETEKGMIMPNNGVSEPEALTQMRKSEMLKRITLGEISKRVISVFEDYS